MPIPKGVGIFLLTSKFVCVIIYVKYILGGVPLESFEEYMEDFLEGVAATVNVDYGSLESVKKSNKGVEIYRKSAVSIDKYYPERLCEFAKLMESDLPKAGLCCAVSLLELTEHYSDEEEARALEIITRTMEKCDDAEKYGWSIWLQKHKSRK